MTNEELNAHISEMDLECRKLYRWVAVGVLHRANETVARITAMHGSTRPILVQLSSSPRFSASATASADADIIVVNRGLICSLYNYFSLLWMDSTYSPMAGDNNKEQDFRCREIKSFLQDQNQAVPFARRLAINNGRTLVDPIADPRRKAAALFQVRAAIDFIFFHEFIHIWHGHLDLKTNGREMKFVDEEGSNTSLLPRQNQWLELDADRHAAIEALDMNIHYSIRDATGLVFAGVDETYGPNASQVLLSASSFDSVFQLFATLEAYKGRRAMYPSLLVRRFNTCIGVRGYASGRFAHLLQEGTIPSIDLAAAIHSNVAFAHFSARVAPESGQMLMEARLAARQFKAIMRERSDEMFKALSPYVRSKQPLTNSFLQARF